MFSSGTDGVEIILKNGTILFHLFSRIKSINAVIMMETGNRIVLFFPKKDDFNWELIY